MSDRLLHQLREGDKIKPALPRAFAHELLFSGLGHRKAQLISADALRLQRKADDAFKVRGSDPKLPCLFVGSADLACFVVVEMVARVSLARAEVPATGRSSEKATAKSLHFTIASLPWFGS